jgi:hypothetical protein
VGGGNYGYFMGKGAINVPIGDTIAVRAAIDHTQHEGYTQVNGVANNATLREDDANNTGWRVAALWQPVNNFSLTLNTIQYRGLSHGQAMKNVLDPDPNPRGDAGLSGSQLCEDPALFGDGQVGHLLCHHPLDQRLSEDAQRAVLGRRRPDRPAVLCRDL